MESAAANKSKRFLNVFHNAVTAWVILFVSLILTLSAYLISQSYVARLAQDRFDFRAAEIAQAIEDRIFVYEQVLWGGVGMMYASEHVERDEFARFVSTLHIERRWPGIQGMGYAVPLTPAQKIELEAQIRGEGFPEFSVKPPGERDSYSSIVYLEPFDWRNQRAFGYDMWSNDMRREAMARARDTGEAATSGMITLVQETKEDVQRGFLTYVPVYSTKNTPDSVEKRRTAFVGWIYAAFRAGDLMQGILGSKDTNIQFEIFDGGELTQDALLFDSNAQVHLNRTQSIALFSKTLHINLQGREWTLHFETPEGFTGEGEQDVPRYVAFGGVVIDLLLFYVILSLNFINRRAEALAEEKTRDLDGARRFWQSMIEALPLSLVVKEANSRTIVQMNKAAEIKYEMSREQIIGRAESDILSTEEIQAISQAEDQAVAEGRVVVLADREVATSQGKRSFSNKVLALNDPSGVPEYILRVGEDVTSQRELEQRFVSLFNGAPSGLLLIDEESIIVQANQTILELFGFEEEELVRQPIEMLVPERFAAGHSKQVESYLKEPTARFINSRNMLVGKHKSGREIPLDIAIRPIKVQGKRHVIAAVSDITERHQFIETLAKASQYKTEFLASMSHELRTPLNAIIGFSNILHKHVSDRLSDRELEALTAVQRNGRHLLTLINDILDLSKIDAGKLKVHKEVFSLLEVIRPELGDLMLMAREKGLELTVEAAEENIMIETDRTRLLQIVGNLVSNAIKYTPSGRVTLKVKKGSDSIIGSCVRIDVVDTGTGIPDADQPKLFREFSRIAIAEHADVQGTGLGLLITSRLVKLLGGRIELSSEFGVGSTFSVLLKA